VPPGYVQRVPFVSGTDALESWYGAGLSDKLASHPGLQMISLKIPVLTGSWGDIALGGSACICARRSTGARRQDIPPDIMHIDTKVKSHSDGLRFTMDILHTSNCSIIVS